MCTHNHLPNHAVRLCNYCLPHNHNKHHMRVEGCLLGYHNSSWKARFYHLHIYHRFDTYHNLCCICLSIRLDYPRNWTLTVAEDKKSRSPQVISSLSATGLLVRGELQLCSKPIEARRMPFIKVGVQSNIFDLEFIQVWPPLLKDDKYVNICRRHGSRRKISDVKSTHLYSSCYRERNKKRQETRGETRACFIFITVI